MMAKLDKNYLKLLAPIDGLDHLRNTKLEETLSFSDEDKTGQDTTCPPDWFAPEECGLPIFPEDIDDRDLNDLDNLIGIEPTIEEEIEALIAAQPDPEKRSEMIGEMEYRNYLIEIYQTPEQLDFLYEFDLGQAFAGKPTAVCLKSFVMFHCLTDLPDTSENGLHLLRGFDLNNVQTSSPFAVTCRQDLPS